MLQEKIAAALPVHEIRAVLSLLALVVQQYKILTRRTVGSVLIALVCTTKIVLSLAFIVFFFLFNGLPSEGADLHYWYKSTCLLVQEDKY